MNLLQTRQSEYDGPGSTMSSILDNPAVSGSVLRLKVNQYHELSESGIIPERTELLSGIMVEKCGKSPLHTWTVQFLTEWLQESTTTAESVRVEQPLTFSDSEPEPDLAVVRGTRDDFMLAHPQTAELVIEVAISTEQVDREKAAIYATAGVSEYWLILPTKRTVVVHRHPTDGQYSSVTEEKEQVVRGSETMGFLQLFPAQ